MELLEENDERARTFQSVANPRICFEFVAPNAVLIMLAQSSGQRILQNTLESQTQ